jgi:hypothetical protein
VNRNIQCHLEDWVGLVDCLLPLGEQPVADDVNRERGIFQRIEGHFFQTISLNA